MRIPGLVLFVVAFLATSSAGTSQSAEAMQAYDARLVETLRAIDPEAAEWFASANEARIQSDPATAIELYRKVVERAPSFSPARRRLGRLLAETGNRWEGLQQCRRALALEDSWENQSALALVLASGTPSSTELREGSQLAIRAMAAAPDEETPAAALCAVALAMNNRTLFEQGIRKLESLGGESVNTLYMRTLAALNAGRFDEARTALDRARVAGLPEEDYQALSRAIDEERPWTIGFLKPLWWTLAIWMSGFALIVGIGWWLSRSTLRTAESMPPTPEGSAQGASIRAVYKTVLAACCAYYYVSLPIVLLIVVGAGGYAIYGMIQLGQVPVKILLVVGVVVLVTLWATIRGLLATRRDEDPGSRLDLSRHPRLRALLDEVAAKIGTEPVTNVYLTPGTEIAVMERGGMAKRVSGGSERCLILGVGVLDGMSLAWFRAILAHEYGHFSNRDTAGGGMALAVRRHIHEMAFQMASGGAATWYNPAWWFLQGFHRVFLFVSQGASRLQEILADRWAAFAYGSQAFEDGLRHVIAASVRFDRHVEGTIQEVRLKNRPLPNLYAYRPEKAPNEAVLEREIHKALDREPSAWDSHPCPRDRFRWVRGLRVSEPDSAEAAGAWELFSDREELEKTMTLEIRTALVRRRILSPS